MSEKRSVSAAVIVAHPDDETIWAGGTLLLHPDWQLTVVSLCRGDDSDQVPRFLLVVEEFKAEAIIGNLDDRPDQELTDTN